MNYAINDFSSLKYLVECSVWECAQLSPESTLIVVSTKNDLREVCYWTSLFDETVEEPISKEDAIAFTKAIGAVSFIETSAMTGEGTAYFIHQLALIRHAHLKLLKNHNLISDHTKTKKCSVQ